MSTEDDVIHHYANTDILSPECGDRVMCLDGDSVSVGFYIKGDGDLARVECISTVIENNISCKWENLYFLSSSDDCNTLRLSLAEGDRVVVAPGYKPPYISTLESISYKLCALEDDDSVHFSNVYFLSRDKDKPAPLLTKTPNGRFQNNKRITPEVGHYVTYLYDDGITFGPSMAPMSQIVKIDRLQNLAKVAMIGPETETVINISSLWVLPGDPKGRHY